MKRTDIVGVRIHKDVYVKIRSIAAARKQAIGSLVTEILDEYAKKHVKEISHQKFPVS